MINNSFSQDQRTSLPNLLEFNKLVRNFHRNCRFQHLLKMYQQMKYHLFFQHHHFFIQALSEKIQLVGWFAVRGKLDDLKGE